MSNVMSKKSSPLITSLHQTLLSIHNNPYPTLVNPANCSRRASVALIIRIRPAYSEEPPASVIEHSASNAADLQKPQSDPHTPSERLDSFFSRPWVQTGVAEILFIKRAARRGDRWTSHIALPGGKRDADDPSDEVTAERETFEEVGLDISAATDSAVLAGSLPQRIVTTDFGAVPLMVLCPFVYLITDSNVSRLKLQPAEVASAHWIPIAALLDPSARTYERADIVDRFASRWGKMARTALSWSLGQVLYAAIRLRPSESLHSAEAQDLPELKIPQSNTGLLSKVFEVVTEDAQSALAKWGVIGADPDPSRRLLLWGLTHGIICDFLGLLPAAQGLDWWRWPTLSRSDTRLMIWLVSYRFRKAKIAAVRAGEPSTAGEAPLVIIGEGLGVKSSDEKSQGSAVAHKTSGPVPATIYSAAGFLLDGYFEQIQRAVRLLFVIRVLFGSAGVWYLWTRYWRRK